MGRKASHSRTQLPGAAGWQTSSSFASRKTRSFTAQGPSTLTFQRSLIQLRRPSRPRSRLLVTSSRSGSPAAGGARWGPVANEVHNPVPAQREVPRRVRALPHALVALPPRREAAHRDLAPAAARAGRSRAERNGSTRCANRCSKPNTPLPCGTDVARMVAPREGAGVRPARSPWQQLRLVARGGSAGDAYLLSGAAASRDQTGASPYSLRASPSRGLYRSSYDRSSSPALSRWMVRVEYGTPFLEGPGAERQTPRTRGSGLLCSGRTTPTRQQGRTTGTRSRGPLRRPR